MKIVRYSYQGEVAWGILEGSVIAKLAGDIFDGPKPTNQTVELQQVKILPPIQPPKILGIGLNYKLHIKESPFPAPEVPMIFLKAPTSVIGHLDTIILPESQRVDYEGEMAVIIGKRAKNVSESEALSCVFGCSVVNDVSARDYHQQDKSFARSKGVDTFCPFGPAIVTGLNPDKLNVMTRLNGKVVQSGNSDDLLFNVSQLISFASKYMTLMPGDMIATGTPAGVGPLKRGDEIEVEVEGVGVLKNFVY